LEWGKIGRIEEDGFVKSPEWKAHNNWESAKTAGDQLPLASQVVGV
jgi:hypothetical protein